MLSPDELLDKFKFKKLQKSNKKLDYTLAFR